MIRSKTYKIVSLSLAFQILFSSLGLTVDIHFCQGEMKRLNLFGIAKSCAEVSQMTKECYKSTHDTCGIDGEHNGCCNNKSFDLDLDFDSGEVFTKPLTEKQKQFIGAFVRSFLLDVQPSPKLYNHSNYCPPLLEQSITVLFQTFLL